MSMKLTRAERDAFLAGVHIAIIAIPEEGKGPLTVPVWYRYEPDVSTSPACRLRYGSVISCGRNVG